MFLAAIMDLTSRQIVGWATNAAMTSDLVLQALVASVWRPKRGPGVLIRSDQRSKLTSGKWLSFLKARRMEPRMSGRGNCHDNAVAETFFSALTKHWIKRRLYPARAAAIQDVFDYVEIF